MTKFTVSELCKNIDNCLKSEFPSIISVNGEIYDFKISGGHAYFILKDDYSSINGIIWRSTLYKLNKNNINLKDGNKVMAKAKVATYSKKSTYQLIIEDVKIDGIGEIQKRYIELEKKMREKGYFLEENKKELPLIIQNVGIITALNGAAIEDVKYALKSNNFSGNIFIRNCSVQGDMCSKTVCSAINYFVKNNFNLDIILITRGGGSLEDLIGFCDEDLIKEIYKCPIFIMSAIGHEVDFMLSDYVADIRAPTPSIAGSIIANTQNKAIDNQEKNLLKTRIMIDEKLMILRNKLSILKDRLIDPTIKIDKYKNDIEKLHNQIEFKLLTIISQYKNKVAMLKNINESFNPDKKLLAGLNILLTDNGKMVKSIDFFKNKKTVDNMILKLGDGEIKINICL